MTDLYKPKQLQEIINHDNDNEPYCLKSLIILN